MSINLSIQFSHPDAVSQFVQYARIDNLAPGAAPVFITVSPNPVASPATIATNVPAGQYQINYTPVYADGRTCPVQSVLTPGCDGLISISAVVSGSVIVITYLAPPTAPKVRLTVNFPNGGNFTANYVNDGNPVSIGIPPGVFGNYSVSGQSVCDETSGFYSTPSGTVNVPVNTVISGSAQLGNTSGAACSAGITAVYTSGTFVTGDTIYLNSGLNSPVVGFIYVLIGGIIYNLNSTTGVLGTNSGLSCSVNNISVAYSNSNSAICSAIPQTIYIAAPATDIATGVTVCVDPGLSTKLTGYTFIKSLGGIIFNIDPTTGIVGASTGDAC